MQEDSLAPLGRTTSSLRKYPYIITSAVAAYYFSKIKTEVTPSNIGYLPVQVLILNSYKD